MSPAGPERCGSTICSVNPAAIAASKALPPRSSAAMPTAEASQCVELTAPNVPSSSGRVVKSPGVKLPGPDAVARWPRVLKPGEEVQHLGLDVGSRLSAVDRHAGAVD